MSLMQSQQPVPTVINSIGGQGGSTDTYRDRKVTEHEYNFFVSLFDYRKLNLKAYHTPTHTIHAINL